MKEVTLNARVHRYTQRRQSIIFVKDEVMSVLVLRNFNMAEEIRKLFVARLPWTACRGEISCSNAITKTFL